jgi:peptidoglycan/xylan/chitin deacetylase (PgdA/CDA1 family)
MATLQQRVMGKWHRTLATLGAQRRVTLQNAKPMVSFTFDDAPASAFEWGRRLLEDHGARGTYYVSLGLSGQDSDVGRIADVASLQAAKLSGHELGCHTFDHLDAWDATPLAYLASIDDNQAALQRLIPGAAFTTFAYPKNGPTWATKRRVATRFACSRGGGQTHNAGSVDANLLSACFLDQRTGINSIALQTLIQRNAADGGWLIFAAHDISTLDAPYSCTPALLGQAIRWAVDAGCEVLPVTQAWALAQAPSAREAPSPKDHPAH